MAALATGYLCCFNDTLKICVITQTKLKIGTLTKLKMTLATPVPGF